MNLTVLLQFTPPRLCVCMCVCLCDLSDLLCPRTGQTVCCELLASHPSALVHYQVNPPLPALPLEPAQAAGTQWGLWGTQTCLPSPTPLKENI